MPFTYRVPIPDEIASKPKLLLKEWLLHPGDVVDVGFPLALVEATDELFALYANGEGVLRNHSVTQGAEIADRGDVCAIMADGEKVPYGRPPSTCRRIERAEWGDAPALEVTVRPDWELRSNCGRHVIRGHLLGFLQREIEPSFLAEIQLHGESFGIHEDEECDVVPHVTLVLHQVELPRTRLVTAVRRLKGWVDRRDHPIDLELSVGKKSQSLRFSLRSERSTMDSRTHPTFTLLIDTEGFCGETFFVVDQSCIRLWLDGIERWLASW